VDTSAQDPTRAPRAQISGIVYRVAYSELVTARLAFISWSGQPLAHAQARPQRVDPRRRRPQHEPLATDDDQAGRGDEERPGRHRGRDAVAGSEDHRGGEDQRPRRRERDGAEQH